MLEWSVMDPGMNLGGKAVSGLIRAKGENAIFSVVVDLTARSVGKKRWDE